MIPLFEALAKPTAAGVSSSEGVADAIWNATGGTVAAGWNQASKS